MPTISVFTSMTNPDERKDPWRQALSCYKDLADDVITIGQDFPDEFKWDYFGEIFPIYPVFSAIKQISIQCSALRRTGLNDSFCQRDFSAVLKSPKVSSRSNTRLSLQNVLTDSCPN